MQRLEVSGAVLPLYGSLGVKGLKDPLDCEDFTPKTGFRFIQITFRTGFTVLRGCRLICVCVKSPTYVLVYLWPSVTECARMCEV